VGLTIKDQVDTLQRRVDQLVSDTVTGLFKGWYAEQWHRTSGPKGIAAMAHLGVIGCSNFLSEACCNILVA